MSTTQPLQQKSDYKSPLAKGKAPLAEDAPAVSEQPDDLFELSAQGSLVVKKRSPIQLEQDWQLRYYFFQCVGAVKKPLSNQSRSEAVTKLAELIRGVSQRSLEIRPGKTGECDEPTLAEHSLALLAAYGTDDDVRLCLKRGIRANAYEFNSLRTPTALMRAVANRNIGTLQALLPHLSEADIQRHNFYGHTALDIAFRQFFGNVDPALKKQDEAILKALRPAYGRMHYFKQYWHHKMAPTPQPDDMEEFDEESALLLS